MNNIILVTWIIEGLDNRGPDNRGLTVPLTLWLSRHRNGLDLELVVTDRLIISVLVGAYI